VEFAVVQVVRHGGDFFRVMVFCADELFFHGLFDPFRTAEFSVGSAEFISCHVVISLPEKLTSRQTVCLAFCRESVEAYKKTLLNGLLLKFRRRRGCGRAAHSGAELRIHGIRAARGAAGDAYLCKDGDIDLR
jgi:hypothetical protein